MTPTQQSTIEANYNKVTHIQLRKMTKLGSKKIYDYLRETGKMKPKEQKEIMKGDGIFNVDELECWVTG